MWSWIPPGLLFLDIHHMEKTVTIEGAPHCQQVLKVPTHHIPAPPAMPYPHYFRVVSPDEAKERHIVNKSFKCPPTTSLHHLQCPTPIISEWWVLMRQRKDTLSTNPSSAHPPHPRTTWNAVPPLFQSGESWLAEGKTTAWQTKGINLIGGQKAVGTGVWFRFTRLLALILRRRALRFSPEPVTAVKNIALN